MKNTKKLALSIGGFGVATMCLVGGTFAWYVVANTGTAVIQGTTANSEGKLTIGIKSSKTDAQTYLENKGYTRNIGGTGDDVGENIYWCPTEAYNNISADVIKAVHYEDGYGTNDVTKSNGNYGTSRPHLKPVTSGRYPRLDDGVPTTNENDILLFKKPTEEDKDDTQDFDSAYINESAADSCDYIKFTLAFYTGTQSNVDIYLNPENCSFDGKKANNVDTEPLVINTLRFGFSSSITQRILSPIKAGNSLYTTNVGGELDLDGDNVYDYVSKYTDTSHDGITSYSYDYYTNWYGEYDLAGDATKLSDAYRAFDYQHDEDDGDGNMVPVNGADYSVMGQSVAGSNSDPWNAKWIFGTPTSTVTSVTTYGFDVAHSSKIVPAKQTSYGIRHFAVDGGTGVEPLTRSDENGIAELDIYIWFEGWESASGSIPEGGLFDAALCFVAPDLATGG